jgi:hypothetical protein
LWELPGASLMNRGLQYLYKNLEPEGSLDFKKEYHKLETTIKALTGKDIKVVGEAWEVLKDAFNPQTTGILMITVLFCLIGCGKF